MTLWAVLHNCIEGSAKISIDSYGILLIVFIESSSASGLPEKDIIVDLLTSGTEFIFSEFQINAFISDAFSSATLTLTAA